MCVEGGLEEENDCQESVRGVDERMEDKGKRDGISNRK